MTNETRIVLQRTFFVAAWVTAIIGIRAEPWPIIVGVSTCLGGALILLAYWATQTS